MMEKKEREPEFPAFPYKPYSIQTDFMKALYRSLDNGGVSMLESPTGTGKTLSIICSALQWVTDQKQKEKSETMIKSVDNITNDGLHVSDGEPDWLRDFVVDKKFQAEDTKIKKEKGGSRLGKTGERKNREISNDIFCRSLEKDNCCTKKDCENLQNKNDGSESIDEEFLLEEYESEEEGAADGGRSKRKAGGGTLSLSTDEEEEDGFDDEEEEVLKVYFCSRTHSQLSQFIKELQKTTFANEVKVVPLGSRKNLCINEEVLKLGNSTHINERCLELQNKTETESCKILNLGAEGKVQRTKASSGCPMLRKPKQQKEFRSEISQQGALDIEDLVHLGRRMRTCPYYGSRSMVRNADLVVLPYQSLLSKSSRESLGLNLKNNIVIIDEAHNLADSLINMYNAKITLSQLENVHSHLEKYFVRFCGLLGSGNRRYIQTLMVITRAFQRILLKEKDQNDARQDDVNATGANVDLDSSVAINEFLFSLNIDNINLVKLLEYIKESNIIHKVSGYGDKVNSLQNGSVLKENRESYEEGSILSGFRALVDMLMSLINNNGDGRIIISKARPICSGKQGQQGGFLKYVMLTGEKIFSEIVGQAHVVVLAGGTLQPIEEMRERLFPLLSPDKFHFFSCSHIVPPESILPVAVSRGPTGKSFDFSYGSRSSSAMIEELGLLLCNLVAVVPEGIIVFFSSFEYEEQVHDVWKSSGILDRIMKKKCVFREPRRNTLIESVLKDYQKTINTLLKGPIEDSPPLNGALLLAVVGGKISEGINFSDGMGRCVVMVGLPYPSPSDIELLERIKHIEGLGGTNSSTINSSTNDAYYDGDVRTGFNILRSCRRRGKEYYENLCMKAVNQSIGRAIRHINDYAAILLVDQRYASASSKLSYSHPASKLPKWIKDRLVSSTNNYGEVHRLLHQFFKHNKNRGVSRQL